MQGDDVIIHPSVQGPEVQKAFPDARIVKPYLRFTADPSVKTTQDAKA